MLTNDIIFRIPSDFVYKRSIRKALRSVFPKGYKIHVDIYSKRDINTTVHQEGISKKTVVNVFVGIDN